ncbi:MAG: DUF3572 family protein [Rhodospirillales bacterium]|jgi:hypothetical protein|nr:DUF3572 family protein [Rhodospirillales bacterium]
MNEKQAQTLALQAAAYIFADEKALDGLMAASGADGDQLRAGMADPAFLAGLLDYLLGNEPLLLEFCEAQEIAPGLPARAQAALMPMGEPLD